MRGRKPAQSSPDRCRVAVWLANQEIARNPDRSLVAARNYGRRMPPPIFAPLLSDGGDAGHVGGTEAANPFAFDTVAGGEFFGP